MNVRCPSCRTVFRVDPAKVPETGIRARCTVCAATMDVRRDGAAGRGPQPRVTEPVAVVAPVRPPTAPTEHRPAAPTIETGVVEAPAPGPPVSAAARLSRPFYQPAAPQPPAAPAAAPPKRPSAPVFRPTPGQPVTAAPVPPPAAATSVGAPPRPAGPAGPAAPAAGIGPPKRPINPFLHQDPQQKARRLARALVSDMIVYQPEKRQRALAAGNLKAAFEEEIQKSWEEYVEQVGEEMAGSTPYWHEALNEILAGGRPIF